MIAFCLVVTTKVNIERIPSLLFLFHLRLDTFQFENLSAFEDRGYLLY